MILRAATYVMPGPAGWHSRLFAGTRVALCEGCGAVVAMRLDVVFTGCRCGGCGAVLGLTQVWDAAPRLVEAVSLTPPAAGTRLDDDEACPGAALSHYRRGTWTP